MKKIFLIIVFIIVALLFYTYGAGTDPQGKLMSVEDYVSQNISEFSPTKEVLGGRFHVTRIEVEDGKGVVEYEDGHIALIADFTYTSSDRTGHKITSFKVR